MTFSGGGPGGAGSRFLIQSEGLLQQSLAETERLVAGLVVIRRARSEARDLDLVPRTFAGGFEERPVAKVDAHVMHIAAAGKEEHQIPAPKSRTIPARGDE